MNQTNPHAAFGPVMLDVEGMELNEADRRRIAHPSTCGVILFSRNFTSRAQVRALCDAIHACKPGVLIAVDHEGGRVQRFRADGFTSLPAMRKLGQLWDEDESASRLKALRTATALGYVLASELRACGVDFSFAPVLDLDWGRSAVIGDRAFHPDPRTVTLLAKSVAHGMLLAGMGCCGKHFPGHGHVSADSHHALPVDDRPLDAILASDAAPYEWFGLGLTAVMPAHVVYSKVDRQPAGFSSVWLQQILRLQLGYTGAIISDDLAMEGAKSSGGVVEAAHSALTAGCDAVLICNRPEMADRLLDGLQWASSPSSLARLQALAPVGTPLAWDDLHASDRFAAAFKLLKAL